MSRRRFYVGPEWPAKVTDYDWLRSVGDADWAWEFLRRNPAYQRDHRLNRTACEKPIRHARDMLLTRTRRRCRRAEAWDLYAFVDPTLSDRKAPVTWLPSSKLPIMAARADRLSTGPDADFRVDAFPGLASIHIDPHGRQHLVIKSGTRRVTICFRGAPVAVAPARVTFELAGLAALFAAQRYIAILHHLLFEDATPAPIDWTTTALEKRDALIALDAHSNNFSHREVAVMIYGATKVDAEWVADGCELKDYVRRCRTRGVRYMQGGYRRLLR